MHMFHVFLLTLYFISNVVCSTEKDCSDDYNIGELIGKGTRVEVFNATRKSDGFPVAIKIFCDDLDIYLNFEFNVYSRIAEAGDSRGCFIKTFGSCKHGDRKAIVMERMKKSLMYVLGWNNPTFRASVSYAKQILECVAEFHKLGYVHQDLRVEHIMFSYDGKIKICNFKRAVSIGQVETMDSLVGIARRAAPESVVPADGQNSFVRLATSDAWGVGLLVFNLFARDDVLEHSMEYIIYGCIKNDPYPRKYIIPYFIHKCIFATGSKLTKWEKKMLMKVKKTLMSCCLFRLPIRVLRETYQHCDSNHWLVKDYNMNLKFMEAAWRVMGVPENSVANVRRLLAGLVVFDHHKRDTLYEALMNPLFH